MSFLITNAYAATDAANAAQPANGGMASIIMLLVFVAVFYLLLLRPQNKRAKAHRELIASLTKGDEVITSGGLLGRINDIHDDFISLGVNEQLEVKVQRSAIIASVPKGTLKSI